MRRSRRNSSPYPIGNRTLHSNRFVRDCSEIPTFIPSEPLYDKTLYAGRDPGREYPCSPHITLTQWKGVAGGCTDSLQKGADMHMFGALRERLTAGMTAPIVIIASILVLNGLPVAAADTPSTTEKKRLSRGLVEDGAQSIATEAAKSILEQVYPAQKIVLPFLGESAVSSAKIVDVSDNFISAVGAAAQQKDYTDATNAFLNTMAYEILMPGYGKVVIGAGKIVIGTVTYEIAVLNQNYRDAVSERFITGRGALLETYKNYLRGITPFHDWGLARERGLQADLGNLYEVFQTDAGLKTQWDRYAKWVETSVGLRGSNLAQTEADLAAAFETLLDAWRSQKEERAVLDAAEYALAQKADMDRKIAENMRQFSRAAEIIRSISSQEHIFSGKVHASDGKSLEGKDLYVKVSGPQLPPAQAVRIQDAVVGQNNTYEVVVKGIKPGMTTIEFAAGRMTEGDEGGQVRGGAFRYRSKPIPIKDIPDAFEAFDQGRWDRVLPVGGGITMDAELAALDPERDSTVSQPASNSLSPVHLFRIWPPEKPNDVSFLLYCTVHEENGLFKFPDGSGGWFWREGEDLGVYRDEECLCAVLRGYGESIVEYNLYAYSVKCPKDGPVQAAPQVRSSGSPAPVSVAPPTNAGQSVMISELTGPGVIISPSGESRPLAGGAGIAPGTSIRSESGAGVVLLFRGGHVARLGANSTARIMAPEAGKAAPNIEIPNGTVIMELKPGPDLPKGITPHLTATATGTRYRLDVSAPMTEIEVLEGKVHVTGSALRRHYDAEVKVALVKELDLAAGEKAVGVMPFMAAGDPNAAMRGTAPGISPLSLPDPWNHPRVQQLMDQWVHSAIPPCEIPGVIMRYNEWAQPLSQAARAVAVPDHPADWTRYRYLWENRARYDSTNLCTLGLFLERSINGQGMEDCRRAGTETRAALGTDKPPTQKLPGPTPLQGVLPVIESIPSASWINGPPDLRAGTQFVIMAVSGFDPFSLRCSSEARRRNVPFVGLLPETNTENGKWKERFPFPTAFGQHAKDALSALATACEKAGIKNPFHPGLGVLVDKNGRIIKSGSCNQIFDHGQVDYKK